MMCEQVRKLPAVVVGHCIVIYWDYIYYIYGKYLAAPQTLATFARHLVEKMAKHF